MHYIIDHAGFEYLDGHLIYPFGHREDPAYERIWDRAWLDECQVAYESSGWVDPDDLIPHTQRRESVVETTTNSRTHRLLRIELHRERRNRHCTCEWCVADEQWTRRTGGHDSWKCHRPYQAHGRAALPHRVDVIDALNGMYRE